MPDAIQPVGAMIQSPDPNRGISTIAGILGLRQQQQGLAIGQQQLQQEQLKTQQAQGVQNFFQTWDPADHLGDDGTTDLDSALQSKEFKASGNAKPAVMQALLDIKQKQLGAKQSLASLNKDLVTQLGTAAGAFVKDDDVVADKTDPKTGVNIGRAKVDALLTNFSKQSPDAARVAGIYQPLLDHVPQGKLTHAMQALQLQAQSASEQQAQQNPQQYAVPTGGTTDVYNINRATGMQPGQKPVQSIRATLAPTEQLPYKRQAAAAGAEGAQGATNDESLYNSIVQKGTKATQIKALTQDIRTLSQEVQTGQFSKAMADKWSALRQTFGFQPGDNSFDTRRQILGKMAAQLRMAAESGASTDSERNGIESALPDPEHMGPAAIDQAARYVGAQQDVNAARAQFANQHRQVNGGKSTGLRETDSAFMQKADPRVFEYQGLQPGQERQNYLRQHFKSKEELKAFLDKQQALRTYGAVQ